MEWVERLNQSMNYIEEHLTDEIGRVYPKKKNVFSSGRLAGWRL